jgi:O-antigen/teichoic acid export membrane protein
VAFGGYHGANILLYRLYDSLPYLVLGRTLSLHAVALYSRGIAICQVPDKVLLGGVASVVLTSYSAEVRNGGDLRTSYLRAIEMITALQWPGLVLTAILAHPIVTLLLGAQWVEVVPLVQIMALASLFTFSAELNYPMLVAFGAMRDVFLRSIVIWPLSALIIAAASFYGLETAALAWLITMPLQAYVSIYFIRRHMQVAWGEIVSALCWSGLLALLSAVGPISVVLYTGSFDLSIRGAVMAVLLAAIGWCAGLLLTAHPLWGELSRVVSVLDEVVRWPVSHYRTNARGRKCDVLS